MPTHMDIKDGGMTTNATTRAIAEEFLSRLGSRSPEDVSSLFTDEVDFLCAGSDRVPWLRPWRTRSDMTTFFATMFESFVPESAHAEVTSILVDGGDAVIMGRVSQRLRSNGIEFTIPFALHLTIADGRITRYHVYEDSLTVAMAVDGIPTVVSGHPVATRFPIA